MTSSFQFHARDESGGPIGNAHVTGVLTRHAFAQGDTTTHVDTYTHGDGGVEVMVDDYVGYDYTGTCEANGYEAQEQSAHASSMNGPFGVWFTMVRSKLGVAPPPGQGFSAQVTGPLAATTTAASTALSGIGTSTAIVLVVVAVLAVIALIVLAYLLGPAKIAGAVK